MSSNCWHSSKVRSLDLEDEEDGLVEEGEVEVGEDVSIGLIRIDALAMRASR